MRVRFIIICMMIIGFGVLNTYADDGENTCGDDGMFEGLCDEVDADGDGEVTEDERELAWECGYHFERFLNDGTPIYFYCQPVLQFIEPELVPEFEFLPPFEEFDFDLLQANCTVRHDGGAGITYYDWEITDSVANLHGVTIYHDQLNHTNGRTLESYHWSRFATSRMAPISLALGGFVYEQQVTFAYLTVTVRTDIYTFIELDHKIPCGIGNAG